jgi:hypothetical protein
MFPISGRLPRHLFLRASGAYDQSKKQAGLLFLVLMLVVLLFATFLAQAADGPNYINTIAGGGQINPNPLQDSLPGPTEITEDSKGNLFVVVPMAQQVYELSGGTVALVAGAGYYSSHPEATLIAF